MTSEPETATGPQRLNEIIGHSQAVQRLKALVCPD